jgi:hypothetical protein
MVFGSRKSFAENKGHFWWFPPKRLEVAAEHYTIFGGNDVAAENYFIFGGYFHRNRQKFLGRRKYF